MAATAAALQASWGRALPVVEDSAEPQSCTAAGSCPVGWCPRGHMGCRSRDALWVRIRGGQQDTLPVPAASLPLALDCCPPFFTRTQIKHLLTEHFEE